MPFFKKKGPTDSPSTTYTGPGSEVHIEPVVLANASIPIWQQLAADAPKYDSIAETSVGVKTTKNGSVVLDDMGYIEIPGAIDYSETSPQSGQKSDHIYEYDNIDRTVPGQAAATGATYDNMDHGLPDAGGAYASPDDTATKYDSSMHSQPIYAEAQPMKDDAGDEKLPAGWGKAFTPDGRAYYLNHALKTTSWVRPTLPAGVKPSLEDYIPLPRGWEYRSYPRPHFVDHNSKTSHMTDPRPLPENWDQRINDKGVAFFVDHLHQRTQWHHPCDGKKAAAIETKRADDGRTYYLNHDTKESSWDNPLLRPGFFGVRGEGLPPGVEKNFTADGREYYLDHRNKTTTWDPPRY